MWVAGILGLYVFEQGFKIMTDAWVGFWAADRFSRGKGSLAFYLGMYCTLAVAFGVVTFIRSLVMAFGVVSFHTCLVTATQVSILHVATLRCCRVQQLDR